VIPDLEIWTTDEAPGCAVSRAVSALMLALCLPAWGETAPRLSYRGSLRWQSFVFPNEGANDSGRLVGLMRLRWEGGVRLTENWSVSYGVDAGFDSHRQIRRDARLFWFDRSLQRPAVDLRLFSLKYAVGDWTVEAGKQLVRWGQTELWSPTDRFTPRDFMLPLEPEHLAVTALRTAWRRGSRRVELVYAPRFTPGRLPLPLQRWMPPLPSGLETLAFSDTGSIHPGGGQVGARYQHSLRQTDFSLSWFEGFNHTPTPTLSYNPYLETLTLLRTFPQMKMVGGDVARVMPWATLRAEGGWFRSNTGRTDDYMQYVAEAERVHGNFLLVAGYTGETITATRASNRLAPDRSLTNLFAGRVQYAVNDRSEVRFEFLTRRKRDAYGFTSRYRRRIGEAWSCSIGGAWLRASGEIGLRQYRLNSHISLIVERSF
jgi:hypothetical protein